MRLGSGQPVRRVTLLDEMGRSPSSGTTRQLITNSSRYGLTSGSYQAEMLELTDEGQRAIENARPGDKARMRFMLAIDRHEVFKSMYAAYLDNRLPSEAVLRDKAKELDVPEDDLAECVETFTVNAKFVGILRTISGAERFISVDALVNDYLPDEPSGIDEGSRSNPDADVTGQRTPGGDGRPESGLDDVCFYITPIGDEGSEARKHSDLFLGSLVEPAVAKYGLRVVRADQIGDAGMITSQIIEYLVGSKLVIADLSYHNPNVFYELALRHAVRRPIVQITRLADKLPFDIGQVRTVVVDTTDIYSLVPQIESLQVQIAAQIRKTLDEGAEVENPLSIFAPKFWASIPRA